jgi:hypothetical protein
VPAKIGTRVGCGGLAESRREFLRSVGARGAGWRGRCRLGFGKIPGLKGEDWGARGGNLGCGSTGQIGLRILAVPTLHTTRAGQNGSNVVNTMTVVMNMLKRRRSLLMAVVLVAIGTLFATSIAAQIVHQHRSVASEATCPICHLFHRVAVKGISAHSIALPRPLVRKVLPRNTVGRLNPHFSTSTPRAPPAA